MFKKNQLFKNTFWLTCLTIAKLIFPLLTLPYLTRILSLEAYGVTAYVKAVMSYFILLIDFGFGLSAVRDLVLAKDDLGKVGRMAGTVIGSKCVLSGVGAAILTGLIQCMPLLREYALFTWLSFIPVLLSVFLLDFLFQGMEKMHVLSVRFVIMKGLSTALTFIVVKSDADLLWIPVLDIASSLLAVGLTLPQVKRLGVSVAWTSWKEAFSCLKTSFAYFLSNMATTALAVLNTVVVGIMLPLEQVALWSVAITLIGAAQSLYGPILNGMYPRMVATKSRKLLLKVLLVMMPLILVAAACTYLLSPWIIRIISGPQYSEAVPVFKALIPMLVMSFPAMLFGWPALGALGKAKETSKTTLGAAAIQVLGLGFLVVSHNFTLLGIAATRFVSEFSLFSFRFAYFYKFKTEYKEK